MEDMDVYIDPVNTCPREAVLDSPLLVASELKFKNFIANNFERQAFTGYNNLDEESFTEKVGKIWFKSLSACIDISDKEFERLNIPSIVSNANIPRTDGGDIDFKDVQFKMQDQNRFQDVIHSIPRWRVAKKYIEVMILLRWMRRYASL